MSEFVPGKFDRIVAVASTNRFTGSACLAAFVLRALLAVRVFALNMSMSRPALGDELFQLSVSLLCDAPLLIMGIVVLLEKRNGATGATFLYALVSLYWLASFLAQAFSADYYTVDYRLATAISSFLNLVGALVLVVLAMRLKISDGVDPLLKYVPGACVAISGVESIAQSVRWVVEALQMNSMQSSGFYLVDPLQTVLSILCSLAMFVAIACLGLWFANDNGVVPTQSVASTDSGWVGAVTAPIAASPAVAPSQRAADFQRHDGESVSAAGRGWICPHCGGQVDVALSTCPQCSIGVLWSSMDFGPWDAELEAAFPGGTARYAAASVFWVGPAEGAR